MTWDQLNKTQHKVVQILTNSINNDRLTHAYVFEGSRGTGKMEVALQLGKSYFCKVRTTAEPCNECADCKRILSRNHPDVHIIEPDGQSIKKQQVELLRTEFSYRGMESKQKFYIIKHAEKMTPSAANSLLKFLEEPEAPTIAVLLTEHLHQMLNTIISRSQILSFSPLSNKEMEMVLVKEGVSPAIGKVLTEITSNLEDARQLCQEDWIVQARSVVLQLTEEIYSRPQQMFFTLQDKWLTHFKGKDELGLGIDLLLLWYRDLLYTQLGETDDLIFTDQLERLNNQALYSSQEKISRQMSAIFDAKRHLSSNVNPQLLMERLMLRLQEG
ncbi:DNA polymerase III subunit delta' [Alkalihalobacterium elongatum]|uniref:DNA polymerase III subunit delta' n=1 Tax=Alkalihalobacterium elongatum TaxID=2675466 RepID=UPI001C1F3A1D|nr:DNA polymerase III subunit delta' [Alkalihalobacterium elongatum]